MKARLAFWQKARLQSRYILEMKIYEIRRSSRCKDGVRYGLILVDLVTGRRVLMDNHHPKGPHIHLDDREFQYGFVNEEKLIEDFKRIVFEHIGVKL